MSTALRAPYPPQPLYTRSQLPLIFINTLWNGSDMTTKIALQGLIALPIPIHSRSERMLGDLLVILALLVESSYLHNQHSPLFLLGRLLISASTCIIFLQCKKDDILRREDGMHLC